MNARSKTHYIGDEVLIYWEAGIKCYRSVGRDSYRFLYGRKSVLQVMDFNHNPYRPKHPRRYNVANVYTLPEHRRKGYARQLFKVAKKILKTKVIYHGSNLSEDGRHFARTVN